MAFSEDFGPSFPLQYLITLVTVPTMVAPVTTDIKKSTLDEFALEAMSLCELTVAPMTAAINVGVSNPSTDDFEARYFGDLRSSGGYT